MVRRVISNNTKDKRDASNTASKCRLVTLLKGIIETILSMISVEMTRSMMINMKVTMMRRTTVEVTMLRGNRGITVGVKLI